MNSVWRPVQPLSTRRSSLSIVATLLLGTVQYYWIIFFYGSISSDIARDMESYQRSIDGLAAEPFEWQIFSPEVIFHRTFVYGEYLASIIFQITGALGGGAIELHALTITVLTLTIINLQFNRRQKASFVVLVTLACPFLFANLLLGNTRQLWGCILILVFYGRIPIFEYFRSCDLSRFALFARIAIFLLIILGTHIGSTFIFAVILVIDYLSSIYLKYRVVKIANLLKHGGKVLLLAAAIFFGFWILVQVDEFWRVQSKVNFYSSQEGLDSYPYLTGGFFYLVILPLSVDVFHYLKKSQAIRSLRFPMLCIWFLIFISYLLPISHAVDRVLTSVVLLGYIKRLTVGSVKNEYIYVSIRLLATVYYIFTK